MKAAIVKGYGKIDEVVIFVDDYPKPVVVPGSGNVLVRVLTCSTSPGDVRTLTGSVDFVRAPRTPYVPSQDICGVVEEIDGETEKFKVGDLVIGTWKFAAIGGMAEYALLKLENVELKPSNIDPIGAAAVANSSVNAMLAVEDAGVKEGDRVLILGGSGGVGSSAIQIARHFGAAYIAATSTNTDLLRSLGVDKAIDYTTAKWWEDEEFRGRPFDKIIDCAEGFDAWILARRHKLLKSGTKGGCFLSVCGDSHHFELHTAWHTMRQFLPPFLLRPTWTSAASVVVPKYKMLAGAPRKNSLARLLALVSQGHVQPVLDPHCPFDFTAEGVRAALKLQESRRAKGKIVVQISTLTE